LVWNSNAINANNITPTIVKTSLLLLPLSREREAVYLVGGSPPLIRGGGGV